LADQYGGRCATDQHAVSAPPADATIADISWHNRHGVTAHYSVAQIVEIRDALELITNERNRFNKSLATLIREKSSPKVPKAERKTG
jgi:hypothetical protein